MKFRFLYAIGASVLLLAIGAAISYLLRGNFFTEDSVFYAVALSIFVGFIFEFFNTIVRVYVVERLYQKPPDELTPEIESEVYNRGLVILPFSYSNTGGTLTGAMLYTRSKRIYNELFDTFTLMVTMSLCKSMTADYNEGIYRIKVSGAAHSEVKKAVHSTFRGRLIPL